MPGEVELMFGAIKVFTILTTAGLIGGQATSIYLKAKNEKNNLLAKCKLKDKEHLENITGEDGLIISKGIQLKKKFDYEGVCIVGPNGSGKTTSVFFPNLLTNNLKGSLIVTDPKGELYRDTSSYQQNICKRKVYRIDLSNPDYSYKYNLLENCRDTQEVLQLANSLLVNGSLSVELATGKKAGGVEWIQMAEPLLAASLLYCKDQPQPFNTIEFALQLIITLDSEMLEILFTNSNNLASITQFNIFKTVGAADRTEGSIKITLATNMRIFTDRNINKICCKTNLNVDNFRNEPSILYISYPERKSAYYAPFIAPFFSQVIDRLIDGYNSKALAVHLLFDEFANIGMLNNMSINVSTVRSRNISFIVCLQSFSQLFQIYGADNAKNILNNLKTKVALPGINDISTLDYLSKLCGDTQIKATSYSTNDKTNATSKSSSNTKRKIFEDGELRTLEDNKVLIITDNKQPVIDIKIKHYEEEKYIANINAIPVKIDRDYFSLGDINKELIKLKLMLEQQEEDDIATRRLFTREV